MMFHINNQLRRARVGGPKLISGAEMPEQKDQNCCPTSRDNQRRRLCGEVDLRGGSTEHGARHTCLHALIAHTDTHRCGTQIDNTERCMRHESENRGKTRQQLAAPTQQASIFTRRFALTRARCGILASSHQTHPSSLPSVRIPTPIQPAKPEPRQLVRATSRRQRAAARCPALEELDSIENLCGEKEPRF